MKKLVIATRNKGKLSEIKRIFAGLDGLELISLLDIKDAPDIIEDGETFEENAIIKAKKISNFTGLPSLSDDSGLEVDALNGRPGVHSARYGGAGISDSDRNQKLLDELRSIDRDSRTARFICVVAIALPDGRKFTSSGKCEGLIATNPCGENGFGYDPVFFLPDFNKTMAQLTGEEKNRISHRAQALEGAESIIKSLLRE